ncbi:MAG: hypothetical protein K2P70_02230 [Hyphomonadaceae bacterium]|jgi:hypothetical protein|nr:hypothetical protein [Hyphomonadaceae bacterium]
MKVRWIILAVAGAIVIAAWTALGVAYFNRPSMPIWIGIVTAAALSLEGFFWVAAGVFGWGFLAKRRASLARLRDRFFGRRQTPTE